MHTAPAQLDSVPTYGCEQCGAPLSLDHIALASDLACAHCGFTTSFPPDVRDRVRDYVSNTRRLWAETLEARNRSLTQEESLEVGPVFISMGFAIISLPFSWFAMRDETTPVVVTGLCLFVFLVSSIASGFLLARIRGVPSIALLLASGYGGCLNCGAPVQFTEGAGVARCHHCDFVATANQHIITDMKLAAARRMNVELSARELRLRHYDSKLNRLGCGLFIVLAAGVFGFFWLLRYLFINFPQTEPRGWILPTFIVIVAGLAGWIYRGIRGRVEETRAYYALIDELTSSES